MFSSTSHGRRRSSTKSTSTKSSHSEHAQQYVTGPEDPGLSFIFIVNGLETNEDPNTGGVYPQYEQGRWVPPMFPQGFYRQTAGDVYRWDNGHVTRLNNFGYRWRDAAIEADASNDAAGGIVIGPNNYPLDRYSTATVFYANPFMKFRSTPGDASARSLYEDGGVWHHLRFHHTPGNISIVDHAGQEDYLAGSNARCPWRKQIIPQAYECQDESTGESGGLAGNLPILIALMAFSCSRAELHNVLTRDESWRNRNWVRHERRTGRREKRGMVVTVYHDPENPSGSTFASLRAFENIDGNSPRPVFRPGIFPD